MRTSIKNLFRRAGSRFLFTMLAIEFLDEFVFGAREAAWPLIRDQLNLNYLQIGLLLSIPGLVSNVVEPILGILADTWKRRAIILTGGVFFAASLLMTALSQNFTLMLVSFILLYPASGAFVSISQATLMDQAPDRRENNMARWTFAGSLGVVAGPLAMGAATWLGVGWRGLFVFFALLSAFLLVIVSKQQLPHRSTQIDNVEQNISRALWQGARQVITALRRAEVLRWLVLLHFSDLMLDVLLGFLALYIVDIAGGTPAQAVIAVGIWSGLGLVGDFLLIPLLDRVSGLAYLRISAFLELIVYLAFLLAGDLWIKIALLGLLGLFNSGWYAILQARLYAANPSQSGTSLAADNIFGLATSLLPLGLGWVAQRYNLNVTMWLIALSPLALLVGLPNMKGRTDADL